METLTCSHGHTFSRAITRGRKPSLCDQHKAELNTDAPAADVLDEEEIPSRPSITGVERAARLFANMALLTKTNRQVIEH